MDNSKSEIQQIIKYVQTLEKRIKQLESKDAIILQTTAKDIYPKPLKLSVEELVNIYNDIPAILTEYIAPVNLAVNSWRAPSDNQIIVELSNQGNYWVILLENYTERIYYLVPNQEKKLRINRLESIKKIFQIQGEKKLENDNYTIIKPAILQIIPSGKEWEVIEKGVIYSGRKAPIDKLTKELEILTQTQEEIPSNLQTLLNSLEKLNKNNQEILAQINFVQRRLDKLEPEDIKWLELYHLEPEIFAKLGGESIKLKLTEETVNKLLRNSTNDVYLEKAEKGGEYILKQGKKGDYLFPDPQTIYDKRSLILTRLANLFITRGEIPAVCLGKDLKVVKPARLTKNNNNQWSLLQSGEINFK